MSPHRTSTIPMTKTAPDARKQVAHGSQNRLQKKACLSQGQKTSLLDNDCTSRPLMMSLDGLVLRSGLMNSQKESFCGFGVVILGLVMGWE
ncbi:hypothetical protein JTE90_001163 [Oedothorax gibbosus]|uniref:Uncharacterized protein n=1 Tax=Oedothorax gibbosus TaxID=931172 RepID=A0AAV6VJ47_9ARAC|nr:hypothetical protein JTE90_001163 [Oedothorax gibbosus]